MNLLRSTVNALETLTLPYCITGSFASSYYGIPRLTHDLDIVIAMNENEIENFFKVFSKTGYLDKEAIKEAIRSKDMFNVIYSQVGLKVDFWVRKENPFDIEMFERRRKVEIAENLNAFIASPEDVILSKLLWARKTRSERQVEDAKGVYEIQKENLDMDYLKAWAEKLGILNKLENLAKSPPPNAS